MANEGDDLALLYLDADDVIVIHADIFNCPIEEAGNQLRSRTGLEHDLIPTPHMAVPT